MSEEQLPHMTPLQTARTITYPLLLVIAHILDLTVK